MTETSKQGNRRMTRQQRFAAMAEKRNKSVLSAAVQEAKAHGLTGITRDAVAKRAGVAAGCVNAAFGTMARLRDAVVAHAIQYQMLEIVAQGLAAGNDVARNAPPDLKARAAATLT